MFMLFKYVTFESFDFGLHHLLHYELWYESLDHTIQSDSKPIQMVQLIETVHLGEPNFFSERTVHLIETFLRNSQWYT